MSRRAKRDSVTIEPRSRTAVGPGHAPTAEATTLDFGHYAGRTVEELVTVDPDYVSWLASHPSGIRYRAEIARVSAPAALEAGDRDR